MIRVSLKGLNIFADFDALKPSQDAENDELVIHRSLKSGISPVC